MTKAPKILAIDQGTTSSRSIVFDAAGRPGATAQQEFGQIYPRDGWVEHDPEEIWKTTVEVCRAAVDQDQAADGDVQAIGITNQRETTVVWERATGKPIYNAIVWQDRRTADTCRQLSDSGYGTLVQEKTGLLIDPYFSATKVAWILENVEGARASAQRGELAFGTIDTFLLWRLTGGKVHATDATNASRTMLYNIHSGEWDAELLDLFRVPRELLPQVYDSAARFGTSEPELFGRALPITGIAGDQQAATIGQACFTPGMIKSTYGTGCFMLLNTGRQPVTSQNRLLTTIAYRLDGETTYALEGSIFIAGAAIQWLRDGLKVIKSAAESEALAAGVKNTGGVYLVPAFTGLGAPYWDPAARAGILGLTRNSGAPQIVRAALESVCYQTRDLMGAMDDDGAARPTALRVDGGMVANNWLMQFLSDILGIPVERPVVTETTALGAAYLAGITAGVYASIEDIADHWNRDRVFKPALDEAERDRLYSGWRKAVSRVRG